MRYHVLSARHFAATGMVMIALGLILLRSWDMDVFREATRQFAAGGDPYSSGYFHNPP